MKKTIIALIIALSVGTVAAQPKKATPDVSGWPKASKDAAKDAIGKYGNPDEATATMLVWYNNGPWAKTIIFKEEIPTIFPCRILM